MIRSSAPIISIIVSTEDFVLDHFESCIRSVVDQKSDDWQLVVVTEARHHQQVEDVLRRQIAASRFKVQIDPDPGSASGLNTGLNAATGQYVAFLDHHDVLAKVAAKSMALAAVRNPTAEILYSDLEYFGMQDSRRYEPFLKPAWSPERIRGNMYVADLLMVSKQAADLVGGFQQQLEGAHLHDLVLRISERGRPVIHVPRRLYRKRIDQFSKQRIGGNQDAAGLEAVTAHCARVGINATVSRTSTPDFYALQRKPPKGTTASIIVPTCGTRTKIFGQDRCLVVESVRTVLAQSYETDYEFVIVYDRRGDMSYLDELKALGGDRVRFVEFAEPFNFSRKCNMGVLTSNADLIVLLNDDIEVISPHWLDHLASLAMEPDVGVAGPKLYFENGLIQHAGLGVHSGAVFNNDWGTVDEGGYHGSCLIDHEVVGVTGACVVVKRSVYLEVGGLSEDYPNSFNDVDFSFKILRAGYRNIAANSLSMYHFESVTRDPTVTVDDSGRLTDRWVILHRNDEFTRGKSLPVTHEEALKNLKKLIAKRASQSQAAS